jgi:hypothetical protein
MPARVDPEQIPRDLHRDDDRGVAFVCEDAVPAGDREPSLDIAAVVAALRRADPQQHRRQESR